jgi:hypothetical protein
MQDMYGMNIKGRTAGGAKLFSWLSQCARLFQTSIILYRAKEACTAFV